MKKNINIHTRAMVVLSGLATFALSASGQVTNIIVNNFDTSAEITNAPWGNWFGGAFQSVAFDTSDASNNPSSGSLLITGVFTGSGQQFFVIDDAGFMGGGIVPPLDGHTVTNFQCDVRFDPSSPVAPNGTFGNMAFGSRGTGFSQPQFGTFSVPSTQTNWVHVSLTVDANAQPLFATIPDVFVQVQTFGQPLVGTTKLYVDNVKFVGPLVVTAPPPPIMSIVKAGPPALRLFAGSTGSIFDREMLATVDLNQSWIGGTYPVSYSFKILSVPADGNIGQTHIFLIPVNDSPVGAYGYNGVDFVATNSLWMVINPVAAGGGSVTASVAWKTNAPNANPDHIALTITNSTAVGTWTLTFNSDTTGSLTAPGASPAAFTITNANVATDFANPVVAYFGLQPNGAAGEGEYEDWASIVVTGVAGNNQSQNFTTSSAISADWQDMSALAGSLVLVTTNTPIWVRWTTPDTGFGLGANANLSSTNNWFTPGYYNGFADIPVTTRMGPKTNWTLIPFDALPTADGTQLGPPSTKAFFRLSNPPPAL